MFTPLPNLDSEYPAGRRTVKREPHKDLSKLRKTPAKFTFSKQAISHLSLVDQILFERFGQGPIVPPTHEIIHHGFEEYVRAQPQAIAVHHLGESITYGELDRHANRLAGLLAQHGVTTGDSVALFLQRSIPMIVGILAILKAGAAYVPQHVGVAPEATLHHIAKVTSTKVILTISSLKHLVPVPEGYVLIVIDEVMQEPFKDNIEHIASFIPEKEIQRDNLCYILFTSGTTGTPNGVQVTHGNVCNILLTEPGNLGIKPGVKVAQILSIAFDMAAWEILGCLGNGGTLVIRGKDFMEAARQVDVIISTPSILSLLDADRCHNIKVVAVAGEPCPRSLADKWAEFAAFYNSCGPTEVTIVNTAVRHHTWSEVLSIGKPTPNNTVYILNEEMKPCAIGEVGEMWAGGDCVSTGYLKNDQLNQERYAPDPFLGNGRRMFRTRDLGRWLENGELEHLGRTDDQVKIRGFRVELDSVSTILESVPHCTHAATLKFDDQSLVAFVTPKTVDVNQAIKAIEKALPYYCVPAMVIPMDEFPITSRGKVDKRTLMELAVTQLQEQEKELQKVKAVA